MMSYYLIFVVAVIQLASCKLIVTINPEVKNDIMIVGLNYTISCYEEDLDPQSITLSHGDNTYRGRIELVNVSLHNRGIYACDHSSDYVHRHFYVGRAPSLPEIVGCEAIADITKVKCSFRPALQIMRDYSIIPLTETFQIESQTTFDCLVKEPEQNFCVADGGFHEQLKFIINLSNDLDTVRVERKFELLKIYRFQRPKVILYPISHDRMRVNWTLETLTGSIDSKEFNVHSYLNCSNTTTYKDYDLYSNHQPLTFLLDFQLRPFTNVTCRIKVKIHEYQTAWSGFGSNSEFTASAKPSAPPYVGPIEKRGSVYYIYINPPARLHRNGIIEGFKSNCAPKTFSNNLQRYESLKNCQIAAYNEIGPGVKTIIPEMTIVNPLCKLEVFSDSARVYCDKKEKNYSIYLIRRSKSSSRVKNNYLQFTKFNDYNQIRFQESHVKSGEYNLAFSTDSNPDLFVNGFDQNSWWPCAYGLESRVKSADFDVLFTFEEDCGKIFTRQECAIRLEYKYPNCEYFASPPEIVNISITGGHYLPSFTVQNSSIPYVHEFTLPVSRTYKINATVTLKNGNTTSQTKLVSLNGPILGNILIGIVVFVVILLVVLIPVIYNRKVIFKRVKNNPFCHRIFQIFKRQKPQSAYEVHQGEDICGNDFPKLNGSKKRQESSDEKVDKTENASLQSVDEPEPGKITSPYPTSPNGYNERPMYPNYDRVTTTTTDNNNIIATSAYQTISPNL